ncbi:GTPase HflX [candidate division WOR-3 bacterium]|nr:GTPase HflX [candidate division WOR-3 bacterium]
MEKVFLVGVLTKYDERWEKLDSLNELAALVKTAEGEVIERILQRRDRLEPRFFIGKGKAHELAQIAQELDIDTFVFDEELTGTQIRNLEDITGRKVIDRTELILDIFAKHAHSKAAKVEVELTQLKYRLSRLTGKGVTLSRLGGGIGTRGPGERKLEIDRRRIRDHINSLERILKSIELSKKIQSSRRKNLFRVALVGYTNAGKSTLMNRLTHSDLLVEDKLFSTLDSTTRVLYLHDSRLTTHDSRFKILLTDTVGFLRKLPHGLIASFKSTLQEAIEADLRLHVIDISHPHCELQLLAGNQILEDLDILEHPIIYVFNKTDLNPALMPLLQEKYPDAVFVSALKGKNLNLLKQRISSFFHS